MKYQSYKNKCLKKELIRIPLKYQEVDKEDRKSSNTVKKKHHIHLFL